MGKSLRWIILGAVVVVLLSAFGILQACSRSSEGDGGQPQAGGVIDASGATPLPADEDAEAPPTPAAYVFARGDIYTSSAQLAIFATAASSSTVLDVYEPGATFTVLEPNGDFREYPVMSGGASWVRVRAQDGMAGWTKAEAFIN